MNIIAQITLFFSLICLHGYGQGPEQCDKSYEGIKTIVNLAEKGSFFIPDKEIDFYNEQGQLIKTEVYYDTLLTKINTFIYNNDLKLLWRKRVDPTTKYITQFTAFYYDSVGVNNRSIVTTLDLTWIDSVTVDTTGYYHVRYDFVRNEDNLYTERKTYYSTNKIAEFDTTNFEVSYQNWEGDSIVYIEDHYAGRVEYLRKYYANCRLVRTEFLNEEKKVTTTYEYVYKNFDDRGHWLIQEVYKTEDGERELKNKYRREIELY